MFNFKFGKLGGKKGQEAAPVEPTLNSPEKDSKSIKAEAKVADSIAATAAGLLDERGKSAIFSPLE